MPTVFIESVSASSSYKTKTAIAGVKDQKPKATEGKSKADHIKTERERILKRELEALQLRELLDRAVAQLETLDHEDLPPVKSKKTPVFCCEDARRWITRQVQTRPSLRHTEAFCADRKGWNGAVA